MDKSKFNFVYDSDNVPGISYRNKYVWFYSSKERFNLTKKIMKFIDSNYDKFSDLLEILIDPSELTINLFWRGNEKTVNLDLSLFPKFKVDNTWNFHSSSIKPTSEVQMGDSSGSIIKIPLDGSSKKKNNTGLLW